MRNMRKIIVFVLCVAAGIESIGAAPADVTPRAVNIDGLGAPVDVLRDRWGINHIYAKNENDLFFVQGYTAARDRLFQVELWRRQADGPGAEIVGRHELKRDIGT